MGQASSCASVALPLVGLGLLLAASLVVLVLWLRALGQKVADEVVRALGGRRAILAIEKSANCVGVRSRGHGQIRGNGCLALTADELYFRLWVPSRTTRVPLEAVTAVGTGRAFMGKASALEHVRVTFEGGDGQQDEAAWIVRDAQRWKGLVQRAAAKKRG